MQFKTGHRKTLAIMEDSGQNLNPDMQGRIVQVRVVRAYKYTVHILS